MSAQKVHNLTGLSSETQDTFSRNDFTIAFNKGSFGGIVFFFLLYKYLNTPYALQKFGIIRVII